MCCGGGACLSVSQSLAVRLLARDSQALQLKRSCLWFSGCVSGTRLSLKPLIYHQENNQMCPRAPTTYTPSPPPARPPVTPPFCPASPSPGLFFSLHYHHSFLSLSSPPFPPFSGPAIHPSSSSQHHPRLPFPPLSNQHKMVLKLPLELPAAARAAEALAAAAAAQAAAVVAAAVHCDWWLALGWSVPLIY